LTQDLWPYARPKNPPASRPAARQVRPPDPVRHVQPVRFHGVAGRPGAVQLLRTARLGVPDRRGRGASPSTRSPS